MSLDKNALAKAFIAADNARNAALREDANDQISALNDAVVSAIQTYIDGLALEPTDEQVQAACDTYYRQVGFDWDYHQRMGRHKPNLDAMRSALKSANIGTANLSEEWFRDTAMNLMMSTEVEEAVRILKAALKSSTTPNTYVN